MYVLADLGWGPDLAAAFEPHAAHGLAAARVGAQHRGAYVLYSEDGNVWAEPSGRLRHKAVRASSPVSATGLGSAGPQGAGGP
jgi:ribosome biogenesis GTPase